jgi:hypothetical protein
MAYSLRGTTESKTLRYLTMNRITQFFWVCSGAHLKTLEKSPSEASKYAGIGATIFFTGVFAAIAAGYALYTVFDNVYWAIIFGLVWGLMIFNLDRYIVSSMRKEGSGWKQFTTAIPRLILALLISLVIAKPLEMKIFDKEISEELLVMHQEKKKVQEALVDERYAAQRLRLQNQIRTLQNEIDQKAAVRDDLARIAREEADGTGGTMQRNAGPIYKIKKADADRAEKEYQSIKVQNDSLITNARTGLQETDENAADDRLAMNADIADGPAARMEALSRLTASSNAIAMANIFIILLFLAVETAPIFVKLISGKGPYDNEIRIVEYPFQTNRITSMAKKTAESREELKDLPDFDRKQANEKLDALLKSG